MKSYAGPLLEKEVNALKKIHLKNCLYILGGAKSDDNILLLGKNKVLACGLFGPMCLVAIGKKLGKEEEFMKEKITDYKNSLKRLKIELKKTGKYVNLPIDFGVEMGGKRKNMILSKFPNKFEALDIGDGTQKKYINEIKKAKSIYMKGPAGYYLDKKFLDGTKNILKAISESRAFSLLSGGDLNNAIKMSGISEEKFGHVSLAGGAVIDYLAGKKLPGLEALGFYKTKKVR